jgi:hypothetical protein
MPDDTQDLTPQASELDDVLAERNKGRKKGPVQLTTIARIDQACPQPDIVDLFRDASTTPKKSSIRSGAADLRRGTHRRPARPPENSPKSGTSHRNIISGQVFRKKAGWVPLLACPAGLRTQVDKPPVAPQLFVLTMRYTFR